LRLQLKEFKSQFPVD